MKLFHSIAYGWLIFAGILLSLALWSRLAVRQQNFGIASCSIR